MSKISRRDFIKVGGTAAAAGAAFLAARQADTLPQAVSPASASAGMEEKLVKTTCALCPSGCGLEVRVVNGKAVKVEGNALHPLNQGACCLRGQTALEVLYSPERIQRPRIQTGPRGGGDWKEISWDEALEIVAKKLRELRQIGQPHTVALMHGELRGQMRSTVNRFMAYYGSPNVISRDSLGEGPARLAMLVTQGINGLPVYDLNNASYVFAFGGNLLESSRSVMGNLGTLAFMRRGRPQRGKLVVAHPRLSLTGIKADEWIPIRPGTYGALALGMANVIINSQLYDQEFVEKFCFGFEDFEDEDGRTHMGFKNMVLQHYTLERVSRITGVATEDIARLAGEFATNRPAVAVLPEEPGEMSYGNSLYSAMAVHALNALVGSIDVKGGVLVQRFPTVADWPAVDFDAAAQAGLSQPRLDGAGTRELPLATSVYQNVASRILQDKPYPINALFILNANPVYEIPDSGRFVQALMKVPFVVSFASTLDETAAHADLILPASTFLEVWGDDYLSGTGYAGVSLRQPVVEPLYDTRDPGDVLLQLARLVGGPLSAALPFDTYAELVRYRLSAIDMDWDKFVENGCWSEMVYFNAEPASPAWGQVVGRDRLHAPKDGRFDLFSRELFNILHRPTGPAEQQLADLACLPHFELPAALGQTGDELAGEYPFLLVTQAIITSSPNWQGIIPTLQECYGLQSRASWTSWVEINPQAGKRLGLQNGDLVWVESETGRVQATVRLYPGIWPNAIYLPPGQGHRTLISWGRGSAANQVIGANPQQLITSATEPLTGAAVTNPTRVRIYKA